METIVAHLMVLVLLVRLSTTTLVFVVLGLHLTMVAATPRITRTNASLLIVLLVHLFVPSTMRHSLVVGLPVLTARVPVVARKLALPLYVLVDIRLQSVLL